MFLVIPSARHSLCLLRIPPLWLTELSSRRSVAKFWFVLVNHLWLLSDAWKRKRQIEKNKFTISVKNSQGSLAWHQAHASVKAAERTGDLGRLTALGLVARLKVKNQHNINNKEKKEYLWRLYSSEYTGDLFAVTSSVTTGLTRLT